MEFFITVGREDSYAICGELRNIKIVCKYSDNTITLFSVLIDNQIVLGASSDARMPALAETSNMLLGCYIPDLKTAKAFIEKLLFDGFFDQLDRSYTTKNAILFGDYLQHFKPNS